jgi:hypothetical protein
MNTEFFTVMDGRAEYDVDGATVISVYGAVHETAALALFFAEWKHHDAVLVRWNDTGDYIENPEAIART